jgi:hypothetical protein
VYVDRQGFRELFTLALPLLRAGKDHTKLLLTPLIRYAIESCCSNPGHITNKREANYGAALGEAMGNMAEWLQDMAYTRRIRNFAVVNANDLMRAGSTPVNFWTEGPVHMNAQGYTALSAALVDHAAAMKLSRKTDMKPPVGGPCGVDRAATRQSWVSGNDSAVHRNYDDANRGGGGRGRGSGPYRGRGRGRGHPRWRGGNKFFSRNKPY